MQNPQIIDITSGNTNSQHIGTDSLNGNRLNDRGGFVTATGANGNKYILEHIVDPSQLADEDSDSDDGVPGMGGMYGKMATGGNGPKPGKKTKGRVKIKMEFIENKLRRYTTFSKRKTGIMKKAYELSTLTGTQVMLLVASETGHVYTFATRKLQPMITSESGKALIQTCLNSPEAPPGSQMSMEQRMNPSGFEETELTYGIGDEDGKQMMGEGNSSMFPGMTDNNHNITSSTQSSVQQSSSHQLSSSSSISSLSQSTTNRDSISPPKTSMSMQNTNIIFPSGASVIPIPTPNSHITTSSPSTSQPQTLYRLQQSNPVLSINTGQGTPNTESTSTVQSVSLATPSALIAGSSNNNNNNNGNNNSAVTPSILMYQTAQGIVYATPTDRIFNYQQPATALSVAQSDSTPMSGGQIIAIPVPVSLPNSAQMIQLAATPQSHQTQHMEVGEISPQQPPPNKKQRK